MASDRSAQLDYSSFRVIQGAIIKLLNAFAIVAAFGLVNVACSQSQVPEAPTQPDSSGKTSAQQWDAVSFSHGSDAAPSMNATEVSAIVGMKVTTPGGASIGTVKDVVVDGDGRTTYAIISYGGMMGLGYVYTAVPWTSVAGMLQKDRMVIDESQLENAPILADAKPGAANTSWRRVADSYWRGKVAMGSAAFRAPSSETPSKERN